VYLILSLKLLTHTGGRWSVWYFLMSVVIGAPVLALTGAGYLSTAAGLNDNFRLGIAIAILLAGLLTNYYGMTVTGQLQIGVVFITITVLVITILGSFSKINLLNFKPFMPTGGLASVLPCQSCFGVLSVGKP